MSIKRRLEGVPERIFPKCPSGIRGLDEITFGGLPKGLPTLARAFLLGLILKGFII
jgi:hypothetical protein